MLNMIRMELYRRFKTKSLYVIWLVLAAGILFTTGLSADEMKTYTMEEKQISQYVLLKSGIDHKTLDRLKKNSNITALTLEKLCLILDCQPNDVITFVQK